MKPLEKPPQFTNRLAGAPSPYLRQHQHNPVMWYPWGSEALELARAQDKPILLSTGYSSCYWCHVMEREVFENPSIAAFMNEHFINIKLDREEYPEIDEIYMVARQLLTREGGWPNNVFLTPDLKPFFAGGTFGAQDMGERPAFPRLLEWLRHEWVMKRDEIERNAEDIYRLMQEFLRSGQQRTSNNVQTAIDTFAPMLVERLISMHDEVAGGFGKQPKFLHETYLDFLIHAGHTLQHKQALDTAAYSMLAMSAGGVYDQVGCGFHRYAIDRHWYVPHFEKMLYNQALCASIYTQLYALSNNPLFSDIARGTLEFVAGPMTSKEGGFYAAIDAETEGVEGAYYAWTTETLQRELTEEELAFFTYYYALADVPHYPGHAKTPGQVIVARSPLWDAAKKDNMPYEQLAALSGQAMNKLLSIRNQREAPLLDDKIIASWNGLMIAAFADAYRIFQKEKYLLIAERAADFILREMQDGGGFISRIHAQGQAYIPGQLEDYSYLAHGLIALHRASPGKGWLEKAEQLLDAAEQLFLDPDTQRYALNVPPDNMVISITHATDSTLPSPVAVLLNCQIDIYAITKKKKWLQRVRSLADALCPLIHPSILPEYATLLKALLRLKEHAGNALVDSSPTHTFTLAAQADIVSLHARFAENTVPVANSIVEIIAAYTIADDWYLYPHSAAAQGTTISIDGDDIATILSIEYPTPKKLETADGNTLPVYVKSGEIRVQVKLKNFVTRAPIEVRLSFQPCREGQCLAPSTVSYNL